MAPDGLFSVTIVVTSRFRREIRSRVVVTADMIYFHDLAILRRFCTSCTVGYRAWAGQVPAKRTRREINPCETYTNIVCILSISILLHYYTQCVP